jgi:hypothetical protein
MMEIESCSTAGSDDLFFGPGHADQSVRQALQACWMMLPKDRRNPEETERQFRRLVERALKDFRDDVQAFGPPT